MYKHKNTDSFEGRNAVRDTNLVLAYISIPGLLEPRVPRTKNSTNWSMPQPNPDKSCINAYGTPVCELSSLIHLVPHEKLENHKLPQSHIIIHASECEHLEHILSNMLILLNGYGLYDDAETVTIAAPTNTVNMVNAVVIELRRNKFDKVNVIEAPADSSELATLKYLHTLATNLSSHSEDAHMLYVHTKGLNMTNGEHTAQLFWRKSMGHSVVDKHRLARYLLELGYDTVGSNPVKSDASEFGTRTRVNSEHFWYYSGKFWWSTAKFLPSLPTLEDIVAPASSIDRYSV